jgi:hypothetical protein
MRDKKSLLRIGLGFVIWELPASGVLTVIYKK